MIFSTLNNETESTLTTNSPAHLGKNYFVINGSQRIIQKVGNTIHRINLYLVNDNVFLLDSDVT